MSKLPQPALSACIETGVTTNRVVVREPCVPVEARSPKRYRSDKSVRGQGCVMVSISLPAAELVALDAACDRLQMARSHLLREAVKHYESRARLERAALTIGDLFAANIDPGWDEAQELEAAALAFRNAVRGEVSE